MKIKEYIDNKINEEIKKRLNEEGTNEIDFKDDEEIFRTYEQLQDKISKIMTGYLSNDNVIGFAPYLGEILVKKFKISKQDMNDFTDMLIDSY